MVYRAVLEVSSTVLLCLSLTNAQYQPTWASLDSRPLPAWYDEAKLGIFVHWGVFSVPSFGSEWFWKRWQDDKQAKYVNFMKENYRPDFSYADFASEFTAELWDPARWVDIFNASGAKYVVLTTKHHEGYTLWPSKYSWNWNAMDVGPTRDIVGELAKALRNTTDLHFGVYHSLYEWFNPLWLADEASNFTTQLFPHAKSVPELHELVETYQPDVVWSDGVGPVPSSDYWGSKQFLAWLYNESPVRDAVVVNDRWGPEAICKHGGFYTCRDRYNPGVLQPHKWENCMSVDKVSWGFRREANLEDILTIEEIVTALVETVSCGGNLLLNVGPASDGRITPIFEERLRQLGDWMLINGEAIYGSQPWSAQNDSLTSGVWYTQQGGVVYAIVLEWPEDDIVRLASASLPDEEAKVMMLGCDSPLKWAQPAGGPLQVKFPDLDQVDSRWAWVLVLDGAQRAESNALGMF